MDVLPEELSIKILSFVPTDQLDELYQCGFPLYLYESKLFWSWVLQNNFSNMVELTAEIIHQISKDLNIEYKRTIYVELTIAIAKYAVKVNDQKLLMELVQLVNTKKWSETDINRGNKRFGTIPEIIQEKIFEYAALYDRYQLVDLMCEQYPLNTEYGGRNSSYDITIDAAKIAASSGNVDTMMYFLYWGPGESYSKFGGEYSNYREVFEHVVDSPLDYDTKTIMIYELLDYALNEYNNICCDLKECIVRSDPPIDIFDYIVEVMEFDDYDLLELYNKICIQNRFEELGEHIFSLFESPENTLENFIKKLLYLQCGDFVDQDQVSNILQLSEEQRYACVKKILQENQPLLRIDDIRGYIRDYFCSSILMDL